MEANRPSCPRCAYDLSGVVDSWHETCPLDGICSECGLRLEWCEVLHHDFAMPQWSFEHARRKRLRAFWKTLWRAVRPWRLWSELRMEYEVRVGRLVVFALFSMLTVQAFLVAVPFISNFNWFQLKQPLSWIGDMYWVRLLVWTCWPYVDGETFIKWKSWHPPFPYMDAAPLIGVLSWIVLPVMIAIIPKRSPRIAKKHIARIALYSLTWLPLCLFVWAIPPFVEILAVDADRMLKPGVYPGPIAEWIFNAHEAFSRGPKRMVFVAGAFCFLSTYWGLAFSRYLKLPHPWVTAWCMTACAVALCVILVVFSNVNDVQVRF